MKNPCIECLIRPACLSLCNPWFVWVSKKVSFGIHIPFSEFMDGVEEIGAIKNHYMKTYDIKKIQFERKSPNSVTVCITLNM